MKETSAKLLFIAIFLLIVNVVKAQTDSVAKEPRYNNIVDLNLMGSNIVFSFNYSTILKESSRGVLMGVSKVSYWPDMYKALGYTVQKHFGKKNHHFEAGLGYTLFSWKPSSGNSPHTFSTMPVTELGYSYRNPGKRLTFGIYFQHLFADDYASYEFMPWGGICIGYNFNNPVRLPWLEKLNDEKDKNFSLYAGAEATLGSGEITLNNIGKKQTKSISYSVFLKYYLSHLYIKGIAGYYMLGGNEIEIEDSRLAIFNENPSFVSYGVGLGYMFFQKNGWVLSPEIQVGSYYSNNHLILKPIDVPFAADENLSFEISDPYNSSDTPYFFKGGLSLTKTIFSFLDVNAGCFYSNSCLLNAGRDSSIKLKYKEYQLSFGLQLHI